MTIIFVNIITMRGGYTQIPRRRISKFSICLAEKDYLYNL